VRVDRDAGDAWDAEIEVGSFETSSSQEGDDEGTETAVDVEREFLCYGEARERWDVVYDSVGEVRCRAD
jgi:hypothetical protein